MVYDGRLHIKQMQLVQSFTKVWRSNHCHSRQRLAVRIVPETFGMNCPTGLRILVQSNAAVLPRPHQLVAETPRNVCVCVWYGARRSLTTEESIRLKPVTQLAAIKDLKLPRTVLPAGEYKG